MVVVAVVVAVAVAGMLAAWRLFGVGIGPIKGSARPETVKRLSAKVPFLYRASLNKWWFDELNDLLWIRVGGRVAAFLWWFDRTIVDGTVNGVGALTRDAGGGLRRIQTGRVQNYALGIAVGGALACLAAGPQGRLYAADYSGGITALQLGSTGDLALLVQVHDEIIYESTGDPRTDRRVLELLQDTTRFRIPIIADMKGSKVSWQDKTAVKL